MVDPPKYVDGERCLRRAGWRRPVEIRPSRFDLPCYDLMGAELNIYDDKPFDPRGPSDLFSAEEREVTAADLVAHILGFRNPKEMYAARNS
jgi:hypothetical protein